MSDDAELLRRYVEERSEDAFAELVRRHLNLVYFAALRQLGGDAHAAEDVAQTVFTDLARKARTLSQRDVLASWLYTSTRFAAAKARRTTARRLKHETEAEIMKTLNDDDSTSPTAEWEKLRPLIDDVVHELNARDRGLVLLRFFEGRPFAEIGAACGLTTDAARMRVERALDKMRTLLAKRGVTSTSAALTAALSQQAALAAPAGLAASVASTALVGGSAAATTGVLVFMSTTKVLTAIGAALAIVSLGTVMHEETIHREATQKLATEKSEHQAAAARLHALEARSRDADKELTQLRQTADEVRAQKTSESQRLARGAAAPSTEPAIDPVAAGKAFLAAHPDVKQALVDRSRARVASRFYTLYAELHLSPEQIEGFENLLIEREGLNFNTPETGPLSLRPGIGLSREDVERGVRELIGEEGYRRYQENGRSAGAQQLTSMLASSLYFTSDPLTAQQADDLGQAIMRLDAGRKGDAIRDWDTLSEQAKSVLSATQLTALNNLRAQEEFGFAMKKLAGK